MVSIGTEDGVSDLDCGGDELCLLLAGDVPGASDDPGSIADPGLGLVQELLNTSRLDALATHDSNGIGLCACVVHMLAPMDLMDSTHVSYVPTCETEIHCRPPNFES